MTPSYAYLFLDIDGVLNHKGTYDLCALRPGQTKPLDWIDPLCVQRVNTLGPGVSVVITSSWRHYLGLAETARVLGDAGLTLPVVGGTEILRPPGDLLPTTRACEIGLWLFQRPHVTTWVVVDDVQWERFPVERFVKTDIQVGFTDHDRDRVQGVLAAQGWPG